MIAVYFLCGLLIVIAGIVLYDKFRRKPLSETVLKTFATTLVGLLTREIAGEVKGTVDIDLYFVQAHQLFIHYGGAGLDYYYGLAIAFFATFIAYGGYLYSKRHNLKS